MSNFLFSISFAPVLCMSGALSLAPFLKLLSRKRLAAINGAHALFLITVIGVFYGAAVSGTASFSLIKHALFLYGIMTTLVHILVLPKYFREWIFSCALGVLFHYQFGAIATFLVYRYFGWDSIEAYTRMELLTTILIVVFHWPIRRLIVKTIRPFLACGDITYWRSVFLIPVAMLLASYFMLPGNEHMKTPAQVFGRLFMVTTAYFVCHSVSVDLSLFQEKQAVEEQLRQQKLYYSSMKQEFEKARRQRHDFKHHLVTIQHYIETDSKEGLQEYCGELLTQNEIHDPIPYSGSSAADGVIYHYMKRSAECGIRFSFQGTIRCGGIADTDLCVLLGNALDNAVTGCMTAAQERFICVSVQSEKQLLSILIQNSFDGMVEEQDERILSRKRKNREGVGLGSMRTICQRYGGMMEYSWDENTFTLCVHLPLSVEES